mgnify:CR=1 FL=1
MIKQKQWSITIVLTFKKNERKSKASSSTILLTGVDYNNYYLHRSDHKLFASGSVCYLDVEAIRYQ